MDIHEARVLAEGLMREHHLKGWRLVFDNAKTRAGVCRFDTREIGLSRVLTELHPADLVRATILHEIAHALVGPRHAHDAVWRAKDRALGGTGQRKVSASAPRPVAPWVGTCAGGHEVTRHRRPARPSSCLQCAPAFSAEHLFVWRLHGRPAPSHGAYEAELAAILAAGGPPAPAQGAGRLPVGTRVVLGGTGRYAGLSGQVEKRGRTRYRVRTSLGTVLAPFGLVRAAT